MFPTLINKLSSALQLSLLRIRHSLLCISSIETGSPSGNRKLAPDIVVDIDVVVLVGMNASVLSVGEEPDPLVVVGNDVAILVGEVVDKADMAADNALLDLWIEDTEGLEEAPEDDFAINVVEVLPVQRAAINKMHRIARRFAFLGGNRE